MNSSHFVYNSDICKTTSVSSVGDQTPDSYIATQIAKNMTPLVGGNASHAATGSRPTTATGGDIGVGSLIAYAGNGSSSTDVAHISEVAPVSSQHIPEIFWNFSGKLRLHKVSK